MPPKFRSRLFRRIANVSAILLLACFPLSIAISTIDAQESLKQDSRKRIKPDLGETATNEPSDPQGYKIGVNVDLVMTYATVFEKSGRFVSGLKQEDFKIFEDGVRQAILSFSQEDVPISMGILLDLSGSMKPRKEKVDNAALAFIRASNPEDEVFLIGFNDEVELLQDYTSDIEEINDALENTVVAGSTAIYDAVYLGVQKAHTGIKPKKAVILISDGLDRESYYSLDELVSKVQESDVQVFSIGFLDPIKKKGLFSRKSENEKARDALIRISEETGGKAFFPAQMDELHNIVAEIARELRSQYGIGYFSSNGVRDGSYRRIKVEVAGASAAGRSVRYRRGYYAPKAEATPK